MRSSVILAAALAVAAPASAAPRQVGLDEAIEAATARDPRVRSEEAGIDAARAARASGVARFRPILRVEGNVQVWNKATDVSFAGSGGAIPALPPPATPYEAVIAGLLSGLTEPTRIRDQVTADVTLSIVQPLTPLLIRGDTHEVLDLGVDSAKLAREQARRDAALGAVQAYLQTLAASALESSARQGVAELGAQLARLEALIAGGVALESDRLRLQVAKAAAEQDVIVATARVDLARAALATAMGLPTHAEIAPAPLASIACRPDPTPAEELQRQALERRPELARMQAGVEQASLAVGLAKNQLWPSLNAIAAYSHLEGQALADKDTAFIGLSLAWNAFEWGATKQQVEQSRAQARQVAEQIGALEDGLRLQVEQARLDLRAYAEALSVAALAETQATDQLRLESDRYAAGDATATDVVTAEAALREARDRKVAAHHQCLLAHAALRSAVGDPLTAETLVLAPEGGTP